MPTPAEEAAEAPLAAASLIAALADPGVPEHLVAKVRAASADPTTNCGAVFFEAPLAAVKSLAMVMERAKALPVEARYKAFAPKCRLVGGDDLQNAIGCGLPETQVVLFNDLSATALRPDANKYAILVSVALGCGTNLVRGGSFDIIDDAVTASIKETVIDPAAPSVWSMKLKHSPENPNPSEPWLFCLKRGRSRSEKMPGFNYAGDLRPAPIMTPRNELHLREVPAHIPRPDYAETADPVSEAESKLQQINYQYDEKHLATLRECCVVARGALDATVRAVRPGVTTEALDLICHKYITAHGAYPSPLNYYNFPKSCCTSVNEVICHGIPDGRELLDGDILNLDITAYYKGYHGDLNETVPVGTCDAKSLKLMMTAYKCLQKGISTVKPGARYRDIGEEVTKVAHSRDASVVKSYCGHGIGTLFHCAPNIPHYSRNKAVGTMKEGHVFTIEPMINQGDYKDVTWPDGWTAVTKDGKRSAQYEHTMAVTKDGVELLTARIETSPNVFPWCDPESEP